MGGRRFCLRLSLGLVGCLSRFHVGRGRVKVWLLQLQMGVGSEMRRIVSMLRCLLKIHLRFIVLVCLLYKVLLKGDL